MAGNAISCRKPDLPNSYYAIKAKMKLPRQLDHYALTIKGLLITMIIGQINQNNETNSPESEGVGAPRSNGVAIKSLLIGLL